jgi:hypothetical protein
LFSFCERCIRDWLYHICSESCFLSYIYKIIMAIKLQIYFCNNWGETLQTLIKNNWRYHLYRSLKYYIYLLLINEVFHSNILFIYVITPILVFILSLRRETHCRQNFNNNWHKKTHNNSKTCTSMWISNCIRMYLCNT